MLSSLDALYQTNVLSTFDSGGIGRNPRPGTGESEEEEEELLVSVQWEICGYMNY